MLEEIIACSKLKYIEPMLQKLILGQHFTESLKQKIEK